MPWPRLGPVPERPEVDDDVGHGDHGVEHGHVDVLADAGAGRGGAGRRAGRWWRTAPCRCRRGRRPGEATGGSARLALVVVDARHGLGDRRRRPASRRRAWARVLPKPETEHVDDRRVHGGDVVVAEAHAGQRAALEVLGDDVELRGEVEDELAALGGLQVDADRLRLPRLLRRNVAPTVAALGVGASPGSEPRPRSPPFGDLDLHHVGAEAGEQLGGVGQRLHLLEGEHPHAVEGLAEREGVGVSGVSELHGGDPTGRPSTGSTSTGMPVSCDIVLTGSKVPGPVGGERVDVDARDGAGRPAGPSVPALPKPWVMATTPGRSVSSIRAGGLDACRSGWTRGPGPRRRCRGGRRRRGRRTAGCRRPAPFFSRSTFCSAVLMVCDVRRVISLSWSVGLGEQLVEQRRRPAPGPGPASRARRRGCRRRSCGRGSVPGSVGASTATPSSAARSAADREAVLGQGCRRRASSQDVDVGSEHRRRWPMRSVSSAKIARSVRRSPRGSTIGPVHCTYGSSWVPCTKVLRSSRSNQSAAGSTWSASSPVALR